MSHHPFDLDRLKRAYILAGNTPGREQWSAEEWLKLSDAYAASGWDITPDQWSSAQIADAIDRGRPPCFDDGLPCEIDARDPREEAGSPEGLRRCPCGDGSCVLCDDDGLVPIEVPS